MRPLRSRPAAIVARMLEVFADVVLALWRCLEAVDVIEFVLALLFSWW